MSTGARLGILAGIIVVAIVALVIANGGSDDSNTSSNTTATAASTTDSDATTTQTQSQPAGPPTYTVSVKDAKPVGGIEKINVKKGDQLKIVVKSDTADEIHVHGYDFKKDVEAGGSVTFNFKATIDGAFEIELEDHKQQIAELAVQP
jgi:maltose-binding protein MalE